MSLDILKHKILPAIFDKIGTKFVECELQPGSVGEEQFQSNVVFLTAVIQKDDENIKVPLIVKFEPFHEEVRVCLNTRTQFHNEVFMYNNVLPFLNKENIVKETFAMFYYGVGVTDDSEKNVVVIQDLRPLGFILTREKVYLDYEHLAVTLKKLGKFHALSYMAKKESPKEFYKLANSLKETSWIEGTFYHPIISACFHRALDPLVKQGKHVGILQRLLNRIDAGVVQFMLDLVTPEEPLALICHGDFCRNNILFKYHNGKPTDVMFFDIATARYSSPVVDIAFLLFLNSSREMREAHWHDLLTIYHQAVSATFSGAPSLDDIRNEMLKKAIYGFVHCSFFLPRMLYENPYENSDSLIDCNVDELSSVESQIGGEECTRMLSDMVEELIDRGCMSMEHKFLQTG